MTVPLFSYESVSRSIAATKKSVQRTLAHWQREGLVRRQERYNVVSDVARLSEIAGEAPPAYDHRLR